MAYMSDLKFALVIVGLVCILVCLVCILLDLVFVAVKARGLYAWWHPWASRVAIPLLFLGFIIGLIGLIGLMMR